MVGKEMENSRCIRHNKDVAQARKDKQMGPQDQVCPQAATGPISYAATRQVGTIMTSQYMM